MIIGEIINQKTGEKLIMLKEGDFEYEKPIKHYGDGFILEQMILGGVPKEEINGGEKPTERSKHIFNGAVSDWTNMLKEFKAIELPVNLLKLFDTNKKTEQKKILKELVLTPDVLMALLIKAEEKGYTLSQYSSEYSQEGIDLLKMPLAYRVEENGEIQILGETELSSGQLKQAIEHRKVKIAKILDKGDEWHCFFITFKSLRGEETWFGEKQPHFHYISSAFGIDRAEVVNQIKSAKYKLGNLPHIKFKDSRD